MASARRIVGNIRFDLDLELLELLEFEGLYFIFFQICVCYRICDVMLLILCILFLRWNSS